MKRGILAVVLCIVGGFGLAGVTATTGGCGKKTVVVNAPKDVNAAEVANWYKATGAFSHVADLLQTGEQTLLQAHLTKLPDGTDMLPDGAYYQKLLTGFGRIALTQRSASEYLKTVPNQFGAPVSARVGGYAKAIQGFLQDLNLTGVAGIKDSASQQIVNQTLTEIGAAIQFALAFTTADQIEAQPPTVQTFDTIYADVRLREVFVG